MKNETGNHSIIYQVGMVIYKMNKKGNLWRVMVACDLKRYGNLKKKCMEI